MLLFTLAACLDAWLPEEFRDVETPAVSREDDGVPPIESARFAQGDLSGTGEAVSLKGTLRCKDPGPFHIRVYPNHADDASRRFDAFPRAGFLAEVIQDEVGAFEILAPVGPERLVLAFRDANQDGRATVDEPPFFVDRHGRYMNLDADLENLVLDCSVFPTRSPDNSKISTIGTRGEEAEKAARLKAEGREAELWLQAPVRKTDDINRMLEEANALGIETNGRPPKEGGFHDGSM